MMVRARRQGYSTRLIGGVQRQAAAGAAYVPPAYCACGCARVGAGRAPGAAPEPPQRVTRVAGAARTLSRVRSPTAARSTPRR